MVGKSNDSLKACFENVNISKYMISTSMTSMAELCKVK